jgi:hypothetical protein
MLISLISVSLPASAPSSWRKDVFNGMLVQTLDRQPTVSAMDNGCLLSLQARRAVTTQNSDHNHDPLSWLLDGGTSCTI